MISGCWRFVAVAGATLLLSSASGAATFLVDSVLDETDALPGDGVCATALGSCTLRAAIMEANAWEGADRLDLPPGIYAISGVWPNSYIGVTDALVITGSGPDSTRIDGYISASVQDTVHLTDLSIRGATNFMNWGFMVFDRTVVEGSEACGIWSEGDGAGLTIRSSSIRDNAGCGVYNGDGGLYIGDSVIERNQGFGINIHDQSNYIERTIVRDNHDTGILVDCDVCTSVSIEDSAIIDNTSATRAGGVQIGSAAHVVARNLTISGNVGLRGGAIGLVPTFNYDSSISIHNSTITNNTAFEGGGFAATQHPVVSGSITLSSSIVEGNHALGSGEDCAIGGDESEWSELSVTSAGHNIVGVGCERLILDSTDLVGTAEHPIDALLAPLADNGGPTPTHALLYGSPAIDAGNPAPLGQVGACTSFDQRGVSRPVDGDAGGISRCDIGAYEAPEPFILTSGADGEDLNPGDGVCAAAGGNCTLRAAVMESNAQAGPDRILVPSGTYAAQVGEDDPLAGISIVDDLEIRGVGEGSALITCAAGASHALLTVRARVLLSDLSIGECASVNTSPLIGNPDGDLTLERVKVVGFYSDRSSVIWSNGDLVVRESEFTGNSTENGAIEIGGSAAVRIESTKLFSNSSYDAVINFYGANSLLIDRSTISGNGCGNTYCALHQPGSSTGSVTIRDSLVATNGGGITLVRGRIENSTVSGNRLPSYGVAVVEGTADVSVFSSTIVRNERSNEGVILAGVLVANSIVAENMPAGAECGGITSGGHNLFGTGCAASSLQPTDLLGSEVVPLVPMLAPLRNYDGPTNSHALLVGSPALDAGDPSPLGSSPTACLATDQRGTPRNGDGDGDGAGRCDIGAYELREACSDLADNDGDGSTDTLDAGCQNVAATTESPKCQDGIDNDGDGKFDFDGGASANGGVGLGPADPQCGAAWKNKEGSSCGIGVELVVVLALMRFVRRRGRAARIAPT